MLGETIGSNESKIFCSFSFFCLQFPRKVALVFFVHRPKEVISKWQEMSSN